MDIGEYPRRPGHREKVGGTRISPVMGGGRRKVICVTAPLRRDVDIARWRITAIGTDAPTPSTAGGALRSGCAGAAPRRFAPHAGRARPVEDPRAGRLSFPAA